MSSHPIQPASDPPPPLVPREWHLRLDPLLLLATLGLVACSLVALNGSTQNDVPGHPHYYVIRQAIYAAIGLVLMYAVVAARLLAAAGAALPDLRAMLALIVLGARDRHGHARRQIVDRAAVLQLPAVRARQGPAGRLAGGFLVDRMRRMGRDTTARIMLLGLLPTMLVMAEPDLGSAMVYVAGTLALLFVAGAPWRHFVALGALIAVSISLVLVVAPMAGVDVLKPYQVDRLTSFLHPSANPGQEGYQQQQALIAMGSGEKTGRGVANATQTSLNFLPEHHTDFIFAVIGETFGFAGCALVLSLYALLIWRGLHILTVAKNLYGALIAGGITVMLLFQLFVNIGMNVGIMPITGVTAPLLSFGGSSMLATFLALGLLHSVHAQARETAELQGEGHRLPMRIVL